MTLICFLVLVLPHHCYNNLSSVLIFSTETRPVETTSQ